MGPEAIADKLWASTVITDDDCWEWQGAKNDRGYGHTSWAKSPGSARVHRRAYETFVEAVPPDLELDHICRNRACWNPDHLEIVTHAENMRRARGQRPETWTTHCSEGHEFTRENTYVRKDNGTRQCRTCSRERDRVRRPLKPPNTCRKGLHEMTEENTYVSPSRGVKICRACQRVHDTNRPNGWERARRAREQHAGSGSRALR